MPNDRISAVVGMADILRCGSSLTFGAFTLPRNWKIKVEQRTVRRGSVNALLAVRCGKLKRK